MTGGSRGSGSSAEGIVRGGERGREVVSGGGRQVRDVRGGGRVWFEVLGYILWKGDHSRRIHDGWLTIVGPFGLKGFFTFIPRLMFFYFRFSAPL
jgi:hypothetical protein